MNNHTPPPGIIATIKQLLAEDKGDDISLGYVRHQLGERAFGFMLILALLPSLLPIPGAGTLFGWLLILMGVQVILGIHRPLLPKFILRRKIDKQPIEAFLNKHPNLASQIQRLARPRYSFLISGPAERIAGFFIIILAIPIILPAPLTNVPPAIAVFLLAVAMIQRDGLVALLAYIIGIISLILLTTVYGGLFYGLWMTVTKTLGM